MFYLLHSGNIPDLYFAIYTKQDNFKPSLSFWKLYLLLEESSLLMLF